MGVAGVLWVLGQVLPLSLESQPLPVEIDGQARRAEEEWSGANAQKGGKGVESGEEIG